MELREKLKSTLLIPKSIKEKLLKMDNWSDDIKSILEEIFKRYEKKEKKLKLALKVVISNSYIESVKKIEKSLKDNEKGYLKSLEERISKL